MDGTLILAQMLIEKFPIIGVIGAKGVIFILIATMLIQIAQLIVKLTPSEKDDAAVMKLEKIIGFIMPFLKLLPHVNPTPLASKILEILGKVLKGLKAALSSEKE